MTDPYSFSLLRLVVSKGLPTEYLVMKLVDEGVSLLGTDSVIIVGTDVSNEWRLARGILLSFLAYHDSNLYAMMTPNQIDQ